MKPVSKTTSLEIRMTNPCSEDWNLMDSADNGRFCQHCNKTVIDFTGFSDNDLLEFFRKNPFPVCGRIYESQSLEHIPVNRDQHKLKFRFTRIAAAILSIFSMKTVSAKPIRQAPPQEEVSNPAALQVLPKTADSIIISGLVVDNDRMPLHDAEIQFNGKKYLTDKNGKFSVTLTGNDVSAFNIYFIYGNLVTEVRNYHPAMKSTSYEIIMHEPSKGTRVIAGGIMPVFHIPEGSPHFVKLKGSVINKEARNVLEEFSLVLKSNPYMIVSLQTYYHTNSKASFKRAQQVKQYLVDTFGISADRVLIPDPEKASGAKDEFIVYFTEQQ